MTSKSNQTNKPLDKKNKSESSSIWGGRFVRKPHDIMDQINPSIDFDKRFFRQDIRGSKAHAEMLCVQKIITKSDKDKIIHGLDQIEREIDEGTFKFSRELEDIHMNIESRLATLIGDAAGRLHTGRSRNDQVATDFKLWIRDTIDILDKQLMSLQAALIDLADQNFNQVMPGVTHLQVAQPITFGHHLLAYVEMLGRDRTRFQDGRARLNECPLGSAALAGTSFPIDRDMTSKALGFDRPTANSLDTVSDRDFALEFLSSASICSIHLSRFAEEVVNWTSSQFNFISLSDAFTTGSSIMPQKRNPDAAELVRGKTGRIIGALNALMVMMKGLPLAFCKDMQEDKEPLFDSFDTNSLVLTALTGIFDSVVFNKEKMSEATDKPFSMAIDLAEYLVHKGMPFREAHTMVGGLVKASIDGKKDFKKLVMEDDNFGPEIENFFIPEMAIKRRITPGSTGLEAVEVQKEQIKKRLEIQTSMISR